MLVPPHKLAWFLDQKFSYVLAPLPCPHHWVYGPVAQLVVWENLAVFAVYLTWSFIYLVINRVGILPQEYWFLAATIRVFRVWTNHTTKFRDEPKL